MIPAESHSQGGGLSLLAALFVLCAPALSLAATLTVVGPAGTEIRIDGEVRGTLPLGAQEVEVGAADLEARLPGHLVHREFVKIAAPESAVIVDLDLRPLSRTNAVSYSAVLAGLGQLYQRRTRTGWTMLGLQVSAWMVAAWQEADFQQLTDDYEVLDRQYADALTPGTIASLAAERAAVYDDLEKAETWRNTAIGVAVAIGVWSVYDAWRGHDHFFVDAEVPSLESSALANPLPLTARVGWRVRF